MRMRIGNVEIKNGICLAPMAGIADRAFRELCISYGAGYVVTEMVSAKGLTMGDKKSRELLTLGESENPAAAQIFGDDPEIMAQAAVECIKFNPQIIDINMGCPAPKITSSGAGSKLLLDPPLCGQMAAAARKALAHHHLALGTALFCQNEAYLAVLAHCAAQGKGVFAVPIGFALLSKCLEIRGVDQAFPRLQRMEVQHSAP